MFIAPQLLIGSRRALLGGGTSYVTGDRTGSIMVTQSGAQVLAGSNDDSSYTDIGGNFTLGGSTTQTQTSLNGNSTSYRYYRLIDVSGTASSNPWLREIEFKQN